MERSELWFSDEHEGLIKSKEERFPGQQRQRRIVNWMRDAQSKVSKTALIEMSPLLEDLVGSRTVDSFELRGKSFLNHEPLSLHTVFSGATAFTATHMKNRYST